MLKKILSGITTAVAIMAIVFALCAMWAVFTTQSGKVPSVFGISILRVMSGSMEPELETGCMIMAKKTDISKLKNGDIISYYSNDPQIYKQVNTHRISEIKNENNVIFFSTKGDANAYADPYDVREDEIVGKIVFKSVILGKFIGILSNKYVFILVICIPLALILALNIGNIAKLVKEEVKREIDEERDNSDDKKK